MNADKKRGWYMLAAVVLVLPLLSGSRDPLEAGFADPPQAARLRCYWWWLNGNTDEATITRDLDEMRAKGYGGAILVDANGSEQQRNRMVPAGPMFGTPRWRDLYRHAMKEAARNGLEISLNIESGWNLGGPTVTPEHAAKLLTFSRTTVTGPGNIRQTLAQPPARVGGYRDIAVLAYPLRQGDRRPIRQLREKSASVELGMSAPKTTGLLEDVPPEPGEEDARVSDVLELTGHMADDGTFKWTAPVGTWEILRAGYMASGAKVSTSSGDWQGLAIDYLDRAEFERYWRENVDPLLAIAKPRYVVTDSWELGGVNWTPRMREEFRARRGYDLLRYLPIVAGRILDSRDISNRFLNDLRRTVADLVIDGHYRPFAEMAAKYGMGIHPESGGPHGAPLDALETLGVSTFPQMEFWARSATHRVRDEERYFVKQGSSAAHTYGKTLVAAEGMTSIGPQWEESIWANLKPSFDQAVCEGLNRLVWHTFTSSPRSMGLPGQEYFAGTHLNPNVTWWNKAGPFLAYINRTQFLMQQGVPVSDVLVYYGENVPNFVQWKGADPAHVLPGFDYDVIDERALAQRTAVKNWQIVLPEGTSYRLLVLPDRPSISLDALRAVKRLVEAGATVIGPKPDRTTGIGNDAEVRRIADRIWSRVHVGAAARSLLGVPDFEGPADTDYVHRRTDAAEIYFIRSNRPEPMEAEFTLRVVGKAPEMWHPDTGRIEDAPAFQLTADGRTRLRLTLDPNGSVFVIFRRTASESKVRQVDDRPSPQVPVNGPWTVRFTPGWGAPAEARFDKLISWPEHPEPGIRYYSGTARYSKRIDVPAGGEWTLDLGDVREIAEVWLNGKPLGVLWKRPFAVALGKVSGGAELEVEVVNLWPNRIIGDAQPGVEKRYTSTNITKFTAASPLMPSGLLGPVVLR